MVCCEDIEIIRFGQKSIFLGVFSIFFFFSEENELLFMNVNVNNNVM